MKARALVPVLVLGFFSMPALAQPTPDCGKAETQAEMTACSGLAFDKADAALNALWPKIVAAARQRDADQGEEMKALGVPTTVSVLKDAQRTWIAFRDAECSYEAYSAFGGTLAPMLGTDCKTRLTRARIVELTRSISEN